MYADFLRSLFECESVPIKKYRLHEHDLRSYQRWLSQKIVDIPYCLLAIPMAMGKSATTLDAIRRLLAAGSVRRVIIVGPLRVARETWPDEIEDWSMFAGLDYAVAVGTPEQREAAILADKTITIINRENLRWLWTFIGGKPGWRWDMLVYDESSRLKGFNLRTPGRKDQAGNNKKRNFSEYGVLAMVRDKLSRVVLLSGTPSPNGLQDLGGQCYMLDQGLRLGNNKTAFLSRFFIQNKFSHSIEPQPFAEDQIMSKMSDVMFSLRAEDHIKLPDRQFHDRYVKLSDKHMKEYKAFERSLYSEVYDVEAVSRGVLTNKLLQFCIAKGTEVLSDKGWLPIECFRSDLKVWDGVNWVDTNGLVAQGKKQVVNCYGVDMTEFHEVLTTSGMKSAKVINNVKSSKRFVRAKVRLPDGYRESRFCINRAREQCQSCLAFTLHMWKYSGKTKSVFEVVSQARPQIMWLQIRRGYIQRKERTRHVRSTSLAHLDVNEESMSKPKRQRFFKLRRSRHRYARRMVFLVSKFLERYAGRLRFRFNYRSNRQQPILFKRQLSLDFCSSASVKSKNDFVHEYPLGANDCFRSRRKIRFIVSNCISKASSRILGRRGFAACKVTEVYDILDCGPNNRFTVRGTNGPILVHNCNGSIYRTQEGVENPVKEVIEIHDEKMDVLDSIIEEAAGANILIAYSFRFDLDRIRKRYSKIVVFDEEPNFKSLWNAGKIRMGIAHPASMSHGLNLQFGGHIQVWYGLTWSYEFYDQFNWRLARPGQPNPYGVQIYRIIAKGTVDEDVVLSMHEKGTNQMRVNERVRVRILNAAQDTV